jgi:hypothetical protein
LIFQQQSFSDSRKDDPPAKPIAIPSDLDLEFGFPSLDHFDQRTFIDKAKILEEMSNMLQRHLAAWDEKLKVLEESLTESERKRLASDVKVETLFQEMGSLKASAEKEKRRGMVTDPFVRESAVGRDLIWDELQGRVTRLKNKFARSRDIDQERLDNLMDELDFEFVETPVESSTSRRSTPPIRRSEGIPSITVTSPVSTAFSSPVLITPKDLDPISSSSSSVKSFSAMLRRSKRNATPVSNKSKRREKEEEGVEIPPFVTNAPPEEEDSLLCEIPPFDPLSRTPSANSVKFDESLDAYSPAPVDRFSSNGLERTSLSRSQLNPNEQIDKHSLRGSDGLPFLPSPSPIVSRSDGRVGDEEGHSFADDEDCPDDDEDGLTEKGTRSDDDDLWDVGHQSDNETTSHTSVSANLISAFPTDLPEHSELPTYDGSSDEYFPVSPTPAFEQEEYTTTSNQSTGTILSQDSAQSPSEIAVSRDDDPDEHLIRRGYGKSGEPYELRRHRLSPIR